MGKDKKPCYLSYFIKKGLIVPALFFAVLFSFLLMVCSEYNVLSQIMALPEFYYILGSILYFGVILFIYLFVSAKDRKATFGDSITVGLLLGSVIYALYLVFVLKTISVIRLSVCGALFLISLAYMIIAIARFNPYSEREIFYTKNNLNAYYHVIFKKFGFLGIFFVALAITCFSYLTTKIELQLPASKKALVIICLIIPIVYLLVKTTVKKINMFDATLFSATIALPPTFVLSVFSNPLKFYGGNFYVWVIAFLFVAFFFIIRLLSFDNSPITIKEYPVIKKCKVLDYFYKYSEKFSFLFSLSAGSLIALLTLVFSRFTSTNVFNSILNKETTNFLFLPTYYCVSLILGTFFVGSMLSVINVKAKKITFGDMFNVTCLFYSIFSFMLSIYVLNKIYVVFFACAGFCHLIVLITRIRQYVYAQSK